MHLYNEQCQCLVLAYFISLAMVKYERLLLWKDPSALETHYVYLHSDSTSQWCNNTKIKWIRHQSSSSLSSSGETQQWDTALTQGRMIRVHLHGLLSSVSEKPCPVPLPPSPLPPLPQCLHRPWNSLWILRTSNSSEEWQAILKKHKDKQTDTQKSRRTG